MKERTVLVSACLLGETCRYDGKHSARAELRRLLEGDAVIPVCPEVAGGLSTPRPPAELSGEKVLRENGEDVTAQFHNGARECLEEAQKHDISLAILKSRSPSCGCGDVYDGTFTNTLRLGNGVFTDLLLSKGIDCISDEDLLKDSTTKKPSA
ncbi:MAG: DUF523 domain-containing protein [Candidatus Marinimicrobia bacterium]|nr:DUF523 domain-containing protein [Candidatus Neomarinimicrobiota bacterium]MCF7850963.1 DUF523 domain-containing protein [Candidatus Neomarinimicrobiota bacterium]MCF7905021.1 DUF523 domain-containing protein [Candidatus Neomarinimicrobiota bacterium]